jgi:hypothetical protein
VDTADVATVYKEEIVGDEMRIVSSVYYTIRNKGTKLAEYARNLSNAYFIIEDDKDKNYYLGAMLYGQVFQKFLPGQLLTYSGKYYQVQTITVQNGVVLRRAADHITDRKCYRQRREYALSGFTLDPAMGARRTGRGVELSRGFSDIVVKTHGYFELTSLDNLAAAHRVDLSSIPDRTYKNKAMLCLKLPEVSEDVRFTITILLNEIFITLYPEGYHYITATMKKYSDTVSNIAELLNPIQLNGFEDEEAIYIIEDCEIDLGLLVSVERNLIRFLEIIADCLAWHEIKLEASLLERGAVDVPSETVNIIEVVSDTNSDESDTGNDETDDAENDTEAVETNENDEKDEITNDETDDNNEDESKNDETDEEQTEDDETDDNYKDETKSDETDDNKDDTGNDETDNDVGDTGNDETKDMPENGSVNNDLPPKKYSKSHFLLYGYDRLDPMLNIRDTLRFLSMHCYDKSALEQARINSDLAARIEAEFDLNKPDAHFCDFCAVELSSGEYDILADGRERCTQCSASALKTVEQFTRLYENSLRNMETFFGIRINVAIKVRLANAKKIAKLCGEVFIPTPGFDGRVLAFAKKDYDGNTIYVENGAPKIAAVANIVHELTHIWQYINWDRMKIRSHYGKDKELMVYEGMAKWTEIQYMLFLNEVSYAKRQEIYTIGRDDAYGKGFINYKAQYPLVYGPGYRKTSPFNKEWPLELPLLPL